MRVEKETGKGYRIVIDSKTSIRELRGVTEMSLEGDAVTFVSPEGQLAQLPLGAAGFRKLRRKVWQADVVKKWGLAKMLLLGSVGAFAIYFVSLVVIGFVTYDEVATADLAVQEGYTVEQPQVAPEPSIELPKPWTAPPNQKSAPAESWKP